MACVDLVQFQLKRPATDPVNEKRDILEKTKEDFLPTDNEQSIINNKKKTEYDNTFMVKSKNYPVQSEKHRELTNISSASVLFIDHGVKSKEYQNLKQTKGKKDKRSVAERDNFSFDLPNRVQPNIVEDKFDDFDSTLRKMLQISRRNLKKCKHCGFKKRKCNINPSSCKSLVQICFKCETYGHFPKSRICKESKRKKQINTEKTSNVLRSISRISHTKIQQRIQYIEDQIKIEKKYLRTSYTLRFMALIYVLFNLDLFTSNSRQVLELCKSKHSRIRDFKHKNFHLDNKDVITCNNNHYQNEDDEIENVIIEKNKDEVPKIRQKKDQSIKLLQNLKIYSNDNCISEESNKKKYSS